MTTIGWIRHGSTAWNEQGKIQGHTDIPLSDLGQSQARQLADRLKKDKTWDQMICSDLSRAKETAEIIARALHIEKVEADPRLRERSQGRLEGLTLEERIECWGENWRTLDHGAETDESLFERGNHFLNDVINNPFHRVLVVSHGGFIGYMLRDLVRNLEKRRLGNTSLTIMNYANDEWKCSLYNCTAHLN